MKYHGIIDLHMHSTVSDGTDTPQQILEHVKEAGITLFSVTDHDAVKCSGIIPALLKDGDSQFIPGAEFSCKDGEGQYHILGYAYDPDADSIRQLVEKGHSYRMKKVVQRLDFLKDTFGFTFPEEEVTALLQRDNPGKPHIGNLMVKYGYAETKEQAIKEYINRVHFKSEYISPQEAIESILNSGGIPVLAHPAFGSGDQLILGEEMDRRIRRLIAFGLKGIEAFYSCFSPKIREEMLEIAERYELYITAGSDYHGTNKLISLADTGLDTSKELPLGMQRFLQDVGVRLD